MNIGSSLNLDIFDSKANEVIKCECNIIGKDDKYLFIDYPVNSKTRKTVLLQKGLIAIATYINEYQTLHSFDTEIIKKVKRTVPALAIKLPEKDTITKVQRREYVRVQTAIDVAVHCPKKSFAPFTTVSLDISGGGASLIVPSNEILDDIKKVNLWMVFQMSSGKYQYIYSAAKLIRVKQLEQNRKSVSLQFTSIDPREKQTIVQYCFEKQRQARQRGLI